MDIENGKAALLALPYIANANLVTAPWKKRVSKDGKSIKGHDKRPSGMISTPILIDGVKYLCNITNKTNLNGKITLYALTLKDTNGNIVEGEKMDSSSNVPDSSNKPSTSGNVHFDTAAISHELNPSSQDTKVQQNVEIDKNNQENKNINCNRNMNKKLIRLTEIDLHRIVKKVCE